MDKIVRQVLALSLALTLMTTANAFGGISLITQTDSVHIDGAASEGPTQATPFNQTSTATLNVPFNVSLQNSSVVSMDVAAAYASATQTSLLSVSSQALHLTATGQAGFSSLTFRGPADANASSSFYAVFSVDAPTPYLLTESTDQEGYVSGDDDNSGAALFQGQQVYNANGTAPGVSSLIPPLTNLQYTTGGPQTFSGILSAGTYTFEGGVFAGGPESTGSGSFSADFSVGSSSSGTGSGSGGTTAVPLPTAVWPGIALIALISLTVPRRRQPRA